LIFRVLNRSLVWLLSVLLVLTSFPKISLGEEELSSFSLIGDVTIDVDSGNSITLYEGTKLYTSDSNQDDGYSVNFGFEEIIIQPEFVQWNEQQTTDLPQIVDDQTVIGHISSINDPIHLLDYERNKVGELYAVNYPVYDEDENFIYILMGSQFFLIDKNDGLVSYSPIEVIMDETKEDSLEVDQEQLVNEDLVNNADEEIKEEIQEDEKEEQDHTTVTNSDKKEPSKEVPANISDTISSNQSEIQSFSTKTKELQEFTKDVKYFKVIEKNVPIFDNRSGSLVVVGYLEYGEVYPRINNNNSQNWHEIKFGGFTGYVKVSSTVPSGSETLTNINNKYTNSSFRTIQPLKDVKVYDNSKGSLIPFATLKEGITYPILSDYTNWYRIDVGGRVGYVRKTELKIEFLSSDRYFKVKEDKVSVYDNRSGSLVEVGYLENGEIFPRMNKNNSQNWHEIKFADYTGYVKVSSTQPDDGKKNTNPNTALKNSARTFTTLQDVTVYDNTRGSLIPFAVIKKGKNYPIISDYTNWYQIDVGGKVGYVRKTEVKTDFLLNDQYFKVVEEDVPVYDNRTGSLIQVGTLEKGQVYPRVSDFTNWHKIQFGDYVGFVKKNLTIPDTGKVLKNENKEYKNMSRTFKALEEVPVYDNTSGSLVEFGRISKDQSYPIVSDFGNWWRIIYADRVGYVKKDIAFSGVYKEVKYTNYDYPLSYMVDQQLKKARPQTDKYNYEYGYVSGAYLKDITGNSFPKTGVVTATTLNIRSWNSSTSELLGFVKSGTKLTLISEYSNGWYKVKYPSSWSDAKAEDVEAYVNPNNLANQTQAMYQFVVLSKNAGISEIELNKLLEGKGILEGKADAFIKASKLYNVNEIYLVSHAILETGHGKSTLAKGVQYNGRTVYNMYGIGAYDGEALETGSRYASEQGWFTPEDAIIGGAQFIGRDYINHPTYMQDTLYKMRWNPSAPATHQYATDIGWAYKQTATIADLYSKLNSYTLYLDIPNYK